MRIMLHFFSMAIYVTFIFLLIKEVTLEFMTLQYYDPKP
jgi:hypothetical protein